MKTAFRQGFFIGAGIVLSVSLFGAGFSLLVATICGAALAGASVAILYLALGR